MMIPAKFKHKKVSKGRVRLNPVRAGSRMIFGNYAIKSLDSARLTSKELQSAKKELSKRLNKSGKIWARVFPNIPVTKKAAETRMGKGKGNVEFWVFRVSPGRILFEVGGVDEKIAREALIKCGAKLSVKYIIVKSSDEDI
ncbi:MAG: 50S ribosomal protein L16 [Anaplasmataceae bacterium]|nr:50S ribosomal protein L16 [Anaplasmataceae bacterium]